MQVSVESIGGLQKRLTVQVPSDEVEQEVDNKLKSLQPKVKVAGFRPGKVPMQVIKQRYQGQVRQEVLETLIQKTFREAVTQEKLRPAGGPQIEPTSVAPGEKFEYSATFEVYPDVTLNALDSCEVEYSTVDITEDDIESVMKKLQEQRKTFNEVDRASAQQDQITVDFVGKIDGEAFAGGSAENTPIVIGSQRMIAGFEEQLVGLKAGDETTIEVTFPDDYGKEDLAGKPAQFEIKVKQVAEPKLPEFDEDFVKSFGVESGALEDLKNDVRDNMERELTQSTQKARKQAILDLLVEKNDVELPQALIDSEVQALINQYKQQLPNITEDQMPRDYILEDAKKRVKLGLLIGEVISQNNIVAKAERVDEILQELASTYDDPQSVIKHYRNDQNAMNSIESLALEDAVVDHLAQIVTCKENKLSFDEVMNLKK